MTVVNNESPDDNRQYLDNCSADPRPLSSNKLLTERSFIKFARERSIKVNGVVTGDPRKLYLRGLLPCDGQNKGGTSLLFHPFRMYPLQRILNTREWGTKTSSPFNQNAAKWNRIADLAILLEPIYWPTVIGRRSHNGDKIQLKEYRQKVLQAIQKPDPNEWQQLHETLRSDAAQMDENGALYLLLRLSKWEQRKNIKRSAPPYGADQ